MHIKTVEMDIWGRALMRRTQVCFNETSKKVKKRSSQAS
jgi:hypothetical protein